MQVEITILAKENPRVEISQKVRNFFDKTQKIPGLQDNPNSLLRSDAARI